MDTDKTRNVSDNRKDDRVCRYFKTTAGRVTLVKIKDGEPFDLFSDNKETIIENFEKLITDYGNKFVIGQFSEQRYFTIKYASDKKYSFSFTQQAHHGNWIEQILGQIYASLTYYKDHSVLYCPDAANIEYDHYDELAAHLTPYCYNNDIWFPCFISAENNMIMLPCAERTPFGKTNGQYNAVINENTSLLRSLFSTFPYEKDTKHCNDNDYEKFYKDHCCLHNWDMLAIPVEDKITNVVSVIGYAPSVDIIKNYNCKFFPNYKHTLKPDLLNPMMYHVSVAGWMLNSMPCDDYAKDFTCKVKSGLFNDVCNEIYNLLFNCMLGQQSYIHYLRNNLSDKIGYEWMYINESMTSYDHKENNRLSEIADLLTDMSLNSFYKKMRIHVIGHDKELKKACYYVYSYLLSVANSEKGIRNFFITGKSGNGKTEFIRALKTVFNSAESLNPIVPIITIDTTSLTAPGWRGASLDEAIEPFYRNNPDGIGIIVLDEMDKKIVNTFDNKTINEFNTELQNNLLTMLDGEGISVKTHDKYSTYPTRNTLIIGLGAFTSIRQQISEEKASKIGFVSQSEQNEYDLDITVDTLIKYGAKEELAGRIFDVINFKTLSDKNIKKIIHNKIKSDIIEPMSIPVNNITFSKSAEKEIIEYGRSDTGIRRAVSEINKIVADCVTASMSMNRFIDIHINSFNPLSIRTTTACTKKQNIVLDEPIDIQFGQLPPTFDNLH